MEPNREVEEKISEILMPYTDRCTKTMLGRKGRLVHYTTAENAIKIIRSKNLWMRNARSMSDFSEIEYGFDQLKSYFHNKNHSAKFNAALEKCAESVGKDAIALFDKWWVHIQTGTYVCCLSEHDDQEDTHGRLSMWRAFGRSTAGVAIVFNPPQRYSALPLKVFLSPVAYFPQDRLWHEMDTIINNIESNIGFLKDLPRDYLVGSVYVMLMIAAVTLKHPGFHEEREWRLIHFPNQYPSPHVPVSTEIVGGVPQVVRKIVLANQPDVGITGIELPQLIDKVIIGPSEYALSIYESLSKELTDAGVENASGKVVVSGIPLRS